MAEEDRKKKGEDEEEGEGQPAPAPKSNKLLIIAISAAVLLLVIAVSLIVYFSMKEKSAEIVPNNLVTAGQEAVPEGAADEEEELGDDEKPLGIIFPLETFMVNLTGEMIRPTTQILPLYDIKVTLRAKGIKSVKTLRGTKLKNLEIGDNKATFTMSKLTDYEVAVFMLKK